MRLVPLSILLIALLALVLVPAHATASPQWGTFKRDACVAVGKRQFSSRLSDIQGDWMRACRSTGATVRGQKFPSPSRCKNLGMGGMWGEFDVNDATCKARWGTFKRDACVRTGVRQYSSRLWDIPGGDWTKACKASTAAIGDHRLLPARCRNLGAAGMWGEFDVPDDSCPFWGDGGGASGTVRAECVAVGYRKHYARLWDVPAGADWTQSCRAEAQSVAGHAATRPSACVWKGPLGMWGEWVVKDTSCTLDSLPQDARRAAIATAKLAELGELIGSKVSFARRVSSDRDVMVSLQGGDQKTIAAAVAKSAAPPASLDGYLFRTMTIGATVGGKVLILGGQSEAGAAIDLKGKRPAYAYASAGYDWGPGLAAGAGVNVGFWVCQNNKIGGDGWGMQFGVDDLVKLAAKKPSLDKGPSFTVGLWFNYDNEFQGFTLTPGYGVGANFGGVVFVTTAVDGDETVTCDGRPK